MSRSLSTTFKQAIFAQETSEVFLVLLTLSHNDFAATIRVVNNYANITSNGNTFTAYPFEIDLPGEDDEALSKVELMITNVDKLLVDEIRAISTPVDLTMEIALASSPDTIEATFAMKVRSVEYDANLLVATCNFEDILNEGYPAETYTPFKNPGLF